MTIIAVKSIVKDYHITKIRHLAKQNSVTVEIEIQELSAAIGQIDGLPAKVKLKIWAA